MHIKRFVKQFMDKGLADVFFSWYKKKLKMAITDLLFFFTLICCMLLKLWMQVSIEKIDVLYTLTWQAVGNCLRLSQCVSAWRSYLMHHIIFKDVQNIVSIVCPNSFVRPSSCLGPVLVRLWTVWSWTVFPKTPVWGCSIPKLPRK